MHVVARLASKWELPILILTVACAILSHFTHLYLCGAAQMYAGEGLCYRYPAVDCAAATAAVTVTATIVAVAVVAVRWINGTRFCCVVFILYTYGKD